MIEVTNVIFKLTLTFIFVAFIGLVSQMASIKRKARSEMKAEEENDTYTDYYAGMDRPVNNEH